MDEIRARLEDIGLSAEQVDEVLPLLTKPEETPEPPASSSYSNDLREMAVIEEDPIRRAILMARAISRDLD